MQEPENNHRDGYYAIYHMMEYVRANDFFFLDLAYDSFANESNLKKWTIKLPNITNGDLTDEFSRLVQTTEDGRALNGGSQTTEEERLA